MESAMEISGPSEGPDLYLVGFQEMIAYASGVAEWQRRGIKNDDNCTICGLVSKDVIHAIRDYSAVKEYTCPPKENFTMRQGTRVGYNWMDRWVRIKTDGSVKLGKYSIFDAELWGILDGLSLLQENQCDKVLIQTDSLEAIEVIQVSKSRPSSSTLIRRIRHLLKNVKIWTLEYTPREEKEK
ncbi:hypothetical protein Gogos_015044 [Gossypium gossypioides]|uniref:RNase H type-1 domain-containing protein n=1 Tax=Gossypium gossypioides TaxID=34282 RepID=A0A7J9C0I8_GOSGO|nr:hypothetical protein [Gossypium gossypioides]